MNQSLPGTDQGLPLEPNDRGRQRPKIDPHPLQDIRPGDVLAGKYRVERILGKGGMGIVVAALHLDLHENRAIKLMLPDQLGNAVAVERFLREARASVRLRTEHIAKVFDVGRLESGAPYIDMELLHGVDLAVFLRKHGPMPIEDAVLYVFQACKALAEAHAAGIVHRDIKPSNLFLVTPPNGSAYIKVLDFGISKQLPIPGIEPIDLTGGDVMGSLFYMSPEQMRSARDVDARTDIWALGAVLYRLITNVAPFRASTHLEVFAMVLDRTPCEPPTNHRPDLDPTLERVILSCLEHDHAARMPSMIDLMVALEPFLPSQSLREDDPTTMLYRPPRADAERATTRSAVNAEFVNQVRREIATEQNERRPNLRGLIRTVPMLALSRPHTAVPRPNLLDPLPTTARDALVAPQAAPPRAPPWRWPLPSRSPTDWSVIGENASPPSSASRTGWEMFPSSFPPLRMAAESPIRVQPSMLAAVNAWRANAVKAPAHQPPSSSPTRRWVLTIGLLMAASGVLMLGGAAVLVSAASPRLQESTPPTPMNITAPNPLRTTIPSPSATAPLVEASASPPPALSARSPNLPPTPMASGQRVLTKPTRGAPTQWQTGHTTAVTPNPYGTARQEIKKATPKPGSTGDLWKKTDILFAR